jgi:hypothetical protein
MQKRTGCKFRYGALGCTQFREGEKNATSIIPSGRIGVYRCRGLRSQLESDRAVLGHTWSVAVEQTWKEASDDPTTEELCQPSNRARSNAALEFGGHGVPMNQLDITRSDPTSARAQRRAIPLGCAASELRVATLEFIL